MTTNRFPLICILLAASLVLGGCRALGGSASCRKPQLYEQAQDLPALRIPAGLDAPDTRGALRIPALNEPETPRGPDDPCLDEPPQFSNAPPAAPAAPAAAPAQPPQ